VVTYWRLVSDDVGSNPIPQLKIKTMTEVKTFELAHGSDKAMTINEISKVLLSFGLTINTLEINDNTTTYSIEVLN
jgi:hypothetical protein